MRIIRHLAVLCAATTIATVTTPAYAVDTTTTFTIAGGALTIAAPANASLGSGASGGSISGSLGSVTVTDARSTLLGQWTATVAATDFTTGGATTNETIAKANVSYASLAATSSTGVGVFTPGQLTVLLAQSLSTPRTAYAGTALVGNNTVIWNPTLVVSPPSSSVAGEYTGTVTHSVA
ncbi:hypothetical protein Aph01nite_32760 [Acrocarpospora phusangensis]|uniref:WxL domain-containing protein n=1 Tax=Acrocarpospora phusangensis TaxID=1070424 RepID=A0A919QBG7_9ACTN|nr:hypothetical protein [Acrocarpospora phusangensis]GIH24966.1 hypothetical protein Aph01nite_32760 [Acrocarpospora phusangensis]